MKLPSFGQAPQKPRRACRQRIVVSWGRVSRAVTRPTPSSCTGTGRHGSSPQPACEDSQRPERNRLLRVGLCQRGRRVPLKGTSFLSLGGATETSDVRPLVETWDGRSWSISASVQPKGSTSANLRVRCTSATPTCVTLGTEESGFHKPSIAYGKVWNGKVWRVQPVPVPPGDGQFSELNGFERPHLHFSIGLRRRRRGDLPVQRSLASLAAHREVERLVVEDRQAEARPFRAAHAAGRGVPLAEAVR